MVAFFLFLLFGSENAIIYLNNETNREAISYMLERSEQPMLWVMIMVIAVVGILTDTYTKNKKIEIKRLDKEIELEKLRLKNFDKETEKMKLELDYTKQHLLETKKSSK